MMFAGIICAVQQVTFANAVAISGTIAVTYL
ncbi:MAG: hypothetical protein K0S74_996 [Chlamydiales bacterium]|jgi:hypothetical protein|nr:hypothetical protein [Chlamydiales bacterium]